MPERYLIRVARRPPAADALAIGAAARIGRLAIRSLYREIALAPKPGLVTPESNGSHADMNFHTFVRSIQALREYFPAIAACGEQRPAFARLQALGIAAERAMLAATGGVNTHRGAIFNLGLLCAAAGQLRADGEVLRAGRVCGLVSECWGSAIGAGVVAMPALCEASHGQIVAQRYGSGGARQEAAAGFPAALEVGLPAYRTALAITGDPDLAAVHALFALIAVLEDTNLLWRAGRAGLRHGRAAAAAFIAAGGVMQADWRAAAEAIAADFVARNLSPGGSADLLGVTLFLAELEAAD